MIFLGTSQNEVGTFWQAELIKMPGAGADGNEKIWILYPVGGSVF
jgi:hypothetical protein